MATITIKQIINVSKKMLQFLSKIYSIIKKLESTSSQTPSFLKLNSDKQKTVAPIEKVPKEYLSTINRTDNLKKHVVNNTNLFPLKGQKFDTKKNLAIHSSSSAYPSNSSINSTGNLINNSASTGDRKLALRLNNLRINQPFIDANDTLTKRIDKGTDHVYNLATIFDTTETTKWKTALSKLNPNQLSGVENFLRNRWKQNPSETFLQARIQTVVDIKDKNIVKMMKKLPIIPTTDPAIEALCTRLNKLKESDTTTTTTNNNTNNNTNKRK